MQSIDRVITFYTKDFKFTGDDGKNYNMSLTDRPESPISTPTAVSNVNNSISDSNNHQTNNQSLFNRSEEEEDEDEDDEDREEEIEEEQLRIESTYQDSTEFTDFFQRNRSNFHIFTTTLIHQTISQSFETILTVIRLGWEPRSELKHSTIKQPFLLISIPKIVFLTSKFIQNYGYSGLFVGYSARLLERFSERFLEKKLFSWRTKTQRFIGKIGILFFTYPFKVLAVQAVSRLITGEASKSLYSDLISQISFNSYFLKLYPGIIAATIGEIINFFEIEISDSFFGYLYKKKDSYKNDILRTSPILKYKRMTMTYGLLSSPFLTASACAIQYRLQFGNRDRKMKEFSWMFLKQLSLTQQLWRFNNQFLKQKYVSFSNEFLQFSNRFEIL